MGQPQSAGAKASVTERSIWDNTNNYRRVTTERTSCNRCRFYYAVPTHLSNTLSSCFYLLRLESRGTLLNEYVSGITVSGSGGICDLYASGQ